MGVLAMPFGVVAAGLTYSADTTVALTAPAVNLIIKAGSQADSVTINAGNLQATLPVSTTFTVSSVSRGLTVTHNSSNTSVTVTCDGSGTATAVVTTSTSSDTATFTPTAAECVPPSTGGGGGGGGYVPPSPNPAPVVPVTNNQPGLEQPLAYPVGTLVQRGTTIYLITAPYEAVGFTSWQAFVGLGYQLRYVIPDNLPGYQISTSYFLSSPTQAHPWSAWINYKRTIYYVSPQGLIGVPSWDIFLSNGGEAKYILPANKADVEVLKKNPHLPLLQPDDSRVVR